MHTSDLAWLAGLLEGEGSFMKGPPSRPNKALISLEMTDRDVVERAADLMGVAVINLAPRNERWQRTFAARPTNARAIALMRELRPLMGARRQHQIDNVLATYSPHRSRLTSEERSEMVRSVADGEPVAEVALRMGRHQRTVYRVVAEACA